MPWGRTITNDLSIFISQFQINASNVVKLEVTWMRQITQDLKGLFRMYFCLNWVQLDSSFSACVVSIYNKTEPNKVMVQIIFH